MSRTDSVSAELPAREDGLDPGEVARFLAGAVERLAAPMRPDDMDALHEEFERLTAERDLGIHNIPGKFTPSGGAMNGKFSGADV